MVTFEDYKANYKMPEFLKEILTEEEQETHILICYCQDDDNFDINPDDF